MSFHDWLEIIGPSAVGLVAWAVRHGWRRVEARAEKAEKAREEAEGERRRAHDLEIQMLKNMIADLHAKIALEGRERQAQRDFFLSWAKSLKSDVSAQLSLRADEMERLNQMLVALVKFFALEAGPDGQSLKIGPDLFLIKKTPIRPKGE